MGNQVTYFGAMQADVQVGMAEYQATAGHIYIVSSGLITIASPAYYFMAFKPPATGYNFLIGWDISKTGDELLVQIAGPSGSNGPLVIGGTPSTTLNAFNLNFNTTPSTPTYPPYELKHGTSPIATLTGGVYGGDFLIPGTSQGNQSSGEVQRTGTLVVLENGLQYAWKIIAQGASTKVTVRYYIAHIPVKPETYK